jgi:SNF2 family DNA or RNA helicase
VRLNCPLCRMAIRPTDISHVAVPQAPNLDVSVDTIQSTSRVASGGAASATSSAQNDESALSTRIFSPDAIASSIASLCPTSSVAIDEDSHVVEDEVIGSWSSRISGIVGRLLRIRRNFPNSKTIVFSQWNDVLDLVQECATLNGIQFNRLRGDRGVIKTFREDPACSCLLLLLKSGANGLNLTEATHVILCEPTLSPGVHAQAIARVQRIGQTQQTHVWRNVASGTVEESVVKSCASTVATTGLPAKKSSLTSESLTLQALELLVSESASSDGA